MARSLAELTDAELEAEFLEAEQHALLWAELGGEGADRRSSRWMTIAGELRAELERRASAPKRPRRR